jgi:hypothetical protein
MNYRQLSVTIQWSTDGMVIAPVDRNIFHFFAEGQAMEVIYKSCHVVTVPELNPDADCWIPKADIFWDEYGMRHHQVLTGLSHYFKIIDEAEINALEIARAWIDAELTEDPTL